MIVALRFPQTEKEFEPWRSKIVLIQGVTAKFKTEKGFLGARKSTAAIIALTRRRRGLEETVVTVIRTADDQNNPDSLFIWARSKFSSHAQDAQKTDRHQRY